MPYPSISITPTVWLTGLSASGKSTLSAYLLEKIRGSYAGPISCLDGDLLRNKYHDYSYDPMARRNAAIRKAKEAVKLNSNGIICIASGISHKIDVRKEVHQIIPHIYEVFLNCSTEACGQRDYKGNYKKAIKGKLENFIGISESYEYGVTHDLEVDTEKQSISQAGEQIYNGFIDFINKIQ